MIKIFVPSILRIFLSLGGGYTFRFRLYPFKIQSAGVGTIVCDIMSNIINLYLFFAYFRRYFCHKTLELSTEKLFQQIYPSGNMGNIVNCFSDFWKECILDTIMRNYACYSNSKAKTTELKETLI